MKIFYGFIFGRSIRAVCFYRISHIFYKYKLKPLAQLFWSLNVALHSIEISPLAKIGKNFRLAHSVGTVIGAGVVIGDNVTIYQNVTLGKKETNSWGNNYPTIKNNVIIYPGSIIIGDICVEEDAVIGANSVVINNVPPKSTVVGSPAKILKVRS